MTLNNKNVKEAVATAATSPLWGPKALGLAMTGVGALGTYLQSRKKKEKKSDSSLLDAVRKKQAEIETEVANKETLKKNQDFQDAEKKRGKHQNSDEVKDLVLPEDFFPWISYTSLGVPRFPVGLHRLSLDFPGFS